MVAVMETLNIILTTAQNNAFLESDSRSSGKEIACLWNPKVHAHDSEPFESSFL
jgi:hypothetical protein